MCTQILHSSLSLSVLKSLGCTQTAKEAHSFLFPSHDDTHPGWHLVNTKTDYPKWIKLVVELAGFVESAIKALQDRTMEKIRREISKRTGEVVGMDLALYEIKYAEKNRKREVSHRSCIPDSCFILKLMFSQHVQELLEELQVRHVSIRPLCNTYI